LFRSKWQDRAKSSKVNWVGLAEHKTSVLGIVTAVEEFKSCVKVSAGCSLQSLVVCTSVPVSDLGRINRKFKWNAHISVPSTGVTTNPDANVDV
jgi:hypothetical protein